MQYDINTGTGYRKIRQVRCDINTGTGGAGTDFRTGIGHFGKFGTTSILVPDTSVSSVQPQYRYRRYRYARLYRSQYRYRYNIDTGTVHFGQIGTISTRYRTLRCVWHDINPIAPHCDVIPWSFGSRQHCKPHTPGSPSIFQYARCTETLSTHRQRRKFPERGGLQR